jgi:quercetin dioxygenase-like cupin family protein
MKRSISGRGLAVLMGIVAVAAFSHNLIGQDQQPAAQAAGQGGGRGGGRGPLTPEQAAAQAARVGNSTTMELEGTNVNRRKFEPGNRTYWHAHEGGFIMFVEKGKGRVQHRGQPMKELSAGELDYTPPGVEHWHGAGPNDEMIQLAVVVGGGGINFKDPVTDAEYQGKPK